MEFFKNVLNYIATGSPTGVPVGHIANFLAGILFVLPTYFVYNKMKTRKGMTLALNCGNSYYGGNDEHFKLLIYFTGLHITVESFLTCVI